MPRLGSAPARGGGSGNLSSGRGSQSEVRKRSASQRGQVTRRRKRKMAARKELEIKQLLKKY